MSDAPSPELVRERVELAKAETGEAQQRLGAEDHNLMSTAIELTPTERQALLTPSERHIFESLLTSSVIDEAEWLYTNFDGGCSSSNGGSAAGLGSMSNSNGSAPWVGTMTGGNTNLTRATKELIALHPPQFTDLKFPTVHAPVPAPSVPMQNGNQNQSKNQAQSETHSSSNPSQLQLPLQPQSGPSNHLNSISTAKYPAIAPAVSPQQRQQQQQQQRQQRQPQNTQRTPPQNGHGISINGNKMGISDCPSPSKRVRRESSSSSSSLGARSALPCPQVPSPPQASPRPPQPPQPRLQQQYNRPSLLTAQQKKANHIQSEQKRRANIRRGYDALCETVPALREAIKAEEEMMRHTTAATAAAQAAAATASASGGNRRNSIDGGGNGKKKRTRDEGVEKVDGRAGPRSESVVLQKTIEHIQNMLDEKAALLSRLQRACSILGPGHPALDPGVSFPPLWEREWNGGQGLMVDVNGEVFRDSDEE